jgi:ribosomal protein S27E
MPDDVSAAADQAANEADLDREFYALLRCPACDDRPPVHRDPAGTTLTCERCGRVYPIEETTCPACSWKPPALPGENSATDH